MVASVLATTGELARVAGPGLRAHIGDVLPLIIEAIQDSAGGNKRLTAVSTLGQVRRAPMPHDESPLHDASDECQGKSCCSLAWPCMLPVQLSADQALALSGRGEHRSGDDSVP